MNMNINHVRHCCFLFWQLKSHFKLICNVVFIMNMNITHVRPFRFVFWALRSPFEIICNNVLLFVKFVMSFYHVFLVDLYHFLPRELIDE